MNAEAVVDAGASKASLVSMKMDALNAFIMHHVVDSHVLSLPFLPSIHLPKYLSVHGVMMVLACAIILLIAAAAARGRGKGKVPSGWANALEMFVLFIRDEISIPFLGEKDGRAFTPLFCSFFMFIVMMNCIGLVPCFYTPTSNIGVTVALAGVTFFFMLFGAIYRTGLIGFFKGFMPPGVPIAILALVFPLELLSFLIKAGALAIRLFANMIAGHMLIFCMLGLVFVFGLFALPITIIVLFVYILEVFVCLLQAYIFTLLSAIFIGQRYHPEH